MFEQAQQTSDSTYFSALYGAVFYRRVQSVTDPFFGVDWPPGREPTEEERQDAAVSPLLSVIGGRERFFLRRVRMETDEEFESLRLQVFNPPRTRSILWPTDLLILSEAQAEECRACVSRAYAPSLPVSRESPFALAFPAWSSLWNRSLGALWQSLAPFEWKNKAVRDVAVKLVETLRDLNRQGYFYCDFHFSRMFLTRDGRIFLDYSGLIGTQDNTVLPLLHNLMSYPPEFADPLVMQGALPYPDCYSQNYSLSAFLFYLFFGRCPCDGALLSHLQDNTPWNHYRKFREYYYDIFPVFIFDPLDRRNPLGTLSEEIPCQRLWDEAPSALRRLFVRAFALENVMRQGRAAPSYPSPVEWMECLRALGWTSGF